MAKTTRGWGIARGAKKTKRFAEGGDVPEGGRFAESDPDIYTRARKWQESQSSEETAEPVKAANKTAVRTEAKVSRSQSVKEADTIPVTKASETKDSAAPVKVGTGSGRGGQGGPTAEELSTERRRQKAEDLVREAGTYSDKPEPGRPVFMPGMSGGNTADALRRTGALATRGFDKITPIPNRARPAAQEAIESSRGSAGPALPGPSGAPRVGSPVEAARIGTARAAPRLEAPRASAAERRSAEGFSPEEALAKLKETSKAAPKPRAKPKAKTNPATETVKPKTKPNPRAKSKFNEDEAGTEFAKGGKVKSLRGWGKARGGKSFKTY